MPVKNIRKIKTKKKVSSITSARTKNKQSDDKYSFYMVDGTSSAGKSTICNYFKQFNYQCVQLDDIFINHGKELNERFNEIMKSLKNKYGEREKSKINSIAEER